MKDESEHHQKITRPLVQLLRQMGEWASSIRCLFKIGSLAEVGGGLLAFYSNCFLLVLQHARKDVLINWSF